MELEKAEQYILNRLDNELDAQLYYHGAHHTRDVYQASQEIAGFLGVNGEELELLKTAALFHDSGFLVQYKEHEEAGCNIVREVLPRFSYNEEQIARICGMIMATKIPQSPKNFLEEILCDADLDYLGRNDFVPIGNTLFAEMKAYDILSSEEQWNRIQVSFLGNHRYFTSFGQEMREPHKQTHLREVERIVSTYAPAS